MNVVKHIICELTGYRPGTVDVSQGDRSSRAVSCRLLENGAPWMIPDGATARVAYTLPDGTEGLYDALPDGSPAGEIIGNIVTVELADQLMAQAGMAQVSILVIGPEGGQLATWPIRVMVTANKAARLTVPEEMPPYGAGFAGKIFFGGADGTITPLEIGEGVEIVRQEDGAYILVAYGGAGGGLGADDIIDNLTTEASDKALSARMGFVLKNLIDLNEQRTSESIRGLNADKLDASALPTAIEDALAQAKASGEFDGTDGEDGTTPHIGANGNWYIGSTDTGIEAQGPAGATGRGIKSISRTSGNGAAGTVDTYTITYTDGTKSTYQVRNGANGAKGDKGDTGATGATGATGPQGPAYKLTDADKATITAAVIEGLPKYAGEVAAV